MKRITVGMPLYKGQDFVAEALRALQAQTFANFEVIISVDGNDEISAEACSPFLSDRRFSLKVQPERLDWAGNFNWLLQQPLAEFFCYRQHDDTTAPDFFEKLMAVADERPDCSLVFSDCQYFGEAHHIEIASGVEGDVLHRLHQFLDQMSATPVRGLIRRDAIVQAGLVPIDEFRSNHRVLGWLAKILRWGSFIRVPEPLYLRRVHSSNFYKQSQAWPDDKKLGDWTTVYADFLDAILPMCVTVDERLFFEHAVMDRVCVPRPDRHYGLLPRSFDDSGRFIRKCIQRRVIDGPRPDTISMGQLGAELEFLSSEHARLIAANRALRDELASFGDAKTREIARAVGSLIGRSAKES